MFNNKINPALEVSDEDLLSFISKGRTAVVAALGAVVNELPEKLREPVAQHIIGTTATDLGFVGRELIWRTQGNGPAGVMSAKTAY